jgi:hypothetical protein
LLSEFDRRISAENEAVVALRTADPMRAARGFAAAHRELRNVFADPRSSRLAFARGLKNFEEAASSLVQAIRDAKKESK